METKEEIEEEGVGVVLETIIYKGKCSLVRDGRGSSLRVVVMSDIHSKEGNLLESLPEGDLLLIAGDITQSGQLHEYQQFNSFIKQIHQRNLFKSIIFIAGNHERTLDSDYYNKVGWNYDKIRQDTNACREALFFELPSNVYYLFDSSVVIDNLVIYGSPWVIGGDMFPSENSSHEHFRWGFSLTEEELENKWNLIPSDVDILITHQPPFGVGDQRRNYDLDQIINDKQIFGYEHKGSKSLLSAYQRIHPILHVCGHEHQGYGAYRFQNHSTILLNAAVCDEDYLPINPLLIVDIDSNQKNKNLFYEINSLNKVIINNFHFEGLNLYVATLVCFQMNQINPIPIEIEILAIFLQLITSSPDIDIQPSTSISTILANYSHPEKKLNSRFIPKIWNYIYQSLLTPFSRKENLHIEQLIQKFQQVIFDILDNHHLLNDLHQYRRLSQPANIDVSKDFRTMQLVIPRIYLGPEYPAYNLEYLHKMEITHIVNCCGQEPPFPTEFQYFNIYVNDSTEEDISKYFIPSSQFIREALFNENSNNNSHGSVGKVLIHCQMGISRSATILVAYLMRELDLCFSIAHTIVKRARGFISINEGFVHQLIQWDEANISEKKLLPYES